MSDEFPDVGNLFGYDASDPLGVEEYLRKKKEEEDQKKAEEARLAKEQESNRTFMGDLLGAGKNLLENTFDPKIGILGRPVSGAIRSGIDIARSAIGVLPWNEGINSPEITEALDRNLGGGFEKLVNEPVAQMMEKEFGPGGRANQLPPGALIRAGLFPDPLAGDIGRTTSETVMGPQGPITTTHETTPEDVKEQIATAHQIGGAGEKIAGMALDPNMLAIPAMPGLVSAGLFGPGMVKSAIEEAGQGEYGKAAIDALMAGAVGLHGAKDVFKGAKTEPVSSESRQSEQVVEPDLTTSSPIKKPVDTPVSDIQDLVQTPHEQQAREAFTGYIDSIKAEVARVTGQDHIANATVEYIPGLGTMKYSPEKNAILVDPKELFSNNANTLAELGFHELSHGAGLHDFGKLAYTGEMIPGPRHPVAETIGEWKIPDLPEDVADAVIDAGELGLTKEQLGEGGKTVQASADLREHYTPNMEERAKFSPEEARFIDAFQAAKNNPNTMPIAEAFSQAMGSIHKEARKAELAAQGLKPAKTPEEYLQDIRNGVEWDRSQEANAPKKGKLTKAEEIEKNSLEKFAFEQRMLLKEYADNFKTATTEAGKKLASRNFREAKEYLDKTQARLAQLGGEAETRAARAENPEAIDVEAKVVNTPSEQVTEPTPVPRKAITEGTKKVGDTYTDPEGNRWMVQDISGDNVILRKGKPGGGTTDKVISRAELEGVEAKPNIDQLIEQAKKESAERKVEEAPNQAEVDRKHEEMLKSEPVEEGPRKEVVVSQPAHLLRRVLQTSGLTRFNAEKLAETFKAMGLDVPENFNEALKPLIDELKDRGWINEKVGGTYTVNAAPPKVKVSGKLADVTNLEEQLRRSVSEGKETAAPEKPPEKLPEGEEEIDLSSLDEALKEEATPGKTPNLEQTMKEKLTPDEIQAIAKLFGGETKRKGTKETPQEVLDAQKAALRGLVEKETKGGEGPGEPVEETGEGEGRSKQTPYEVTLSDGSTHIIRSDSPENAQAKAEGILQEGGSTKTVDKVEPHLSSIQKAAKYEIEPVKEGSEAISEEVKDIKKEQKQEGRQLSEQVRDTERLTKEQFRERKQREKEDIKQAKKLGKEEERLRAAQQKEKFEEKPYTINLSNGRTVTIRARTEKAAREVVERRIKAKGSGVTILGSAEKPSALDEAIIGAARKVEESGFLQHPAVRMLNAIKSITFGGDIGHLLRQGKQMNADLLFSKHAGKVLTQFKELYKLVKSENALTDLNDKLYADPDIKTLVDNFGLDMPGMGKGLKEEAFHGGDIAEKLPVIGKLYTRPSERVYTGGLNYLRAAEAKKWVETLKKDGFTPDNAPEKYHAVARAVNIISQRGSFQPAYQKLFSDASAIYGAPRAKAARLQNAVELFKGGTSGNIVRKTAAKTLAFNLGLFGLLKATTGATLVTDPESSDFGKIRISPKITVDPWMGLGVTARTVSKLITGKAKSPYKMAHTFPASPAEYPVKPSEAIMNEFMGGVAPGIKLAWEAMTGTDLRGYQKDRLASTLNVAPLTMKSIAELFQAGDVDQALELSMMQFAGEGVDVFDYDAARKEQQRLLQERGIGRPGQRPSLNF